MKKNLLPVFLLPLLFFSCKKDSRQVTPVNAGTKKYQVQFDVVGFQQIIIGAKANGSLSRSKHSASSRAASGDGLTLNYLVFDSSGKLVHTITQPADSAGTTTVKDSLPAGTYTFCFAIGGASM